MFRKLYHQPNNFTIGYRTIYSWNRCRFCGQRFSRRKDKSGFIRDFKIYECENCRCCPVRSQCTKAKSERNRQILVNNTWRYFKAECKKTFRGKRRFDLSETDFHLRGKQGAKIDIGLAFMALNLRKLGKYMERKRRKEEKTSRILKLTIKVGLVFFWRKDYCPTLSDFRQKHQFPLD